MVFEPTTLPGLWLIHPQKYQDERGWFYECWRQDAFAAQGIAVDFVQDNRSQSLQGVLRGLHFQRPPYAQAKLFSCTAGRVWDVAVDLRGGSATFGHHFEVELSSETGTMLYLPAGFAHGFLTLSEFAQTHYKCSAVYQPSSEGGIRWDDPQLAISWPLPIHQALVSPKDRQLPRLVDLGQGFGL